MKHAWCLVLTFAATQAISSTLNCNMKVPGGDYTQSTDEETYVGSSKYIGRAVMCVNSPEDITLVSAIWYVRDSSGDGERKFSNIPTDMAACKAAFGDEYKSVGFALSGNNNTRRSLGWFATFRGGTTSYGARVVLIQGDALSVPTDGRWVYPKTTQVTYRTDIVDLTETGRPGDDVTVRLGVQNTTSGGWGDVIPSITYRIRPDASAGPVVSLLEGESVTLPANAAPTVRVQIPLQTASGTYTRVMDAAVTCP